MYDKSVAVESGKIAGSIFLLGEKGQKRVKSQWKASEGSQAESKKP